MNQTRLNSGKFIEPTECKLTREERETIYRVDDLDNMCYADSTIPKDIRKLEKQGWIETGVQYYKDGTVMGKQFKAPRKFISPRSYDPNRLKRTMTEEQKQAAKERMKKMWDAKKQKNK